MAERVPWSRDQQLIALRLYMRTPFGKLDGRNPEIISLADRIGRTPSALAMKACNFASLDPAFLATNRRGLSGASEADRELWNEFSGNAEQLAAEAEEAFARFEPEQAAVEESSIRLPTGETDVLRIVRARRVQSFFRAAVLTSYDRRCALSGLAIPDLLITSHIIPWSDSVERRADPRNGICFNALFDRAFDRGLFTFDDSLRVVISPKLRDGVASARLACALDQIEGQALRVPERFPPDAAAICYHREVIFGRAG